MTADSHPKLRITEGNRFLCGLIVLLVAMCAAVSRLHLPLNHDVSWLFVAAGKMLAGGRFGQDIYELNAPGAVLLYAPPAFVARFFGLDPKGCVLVYTAAVLAVCLIVSREFLIHLFIVRNQWRAEAIVVCWAIIWAFLPGYDFAQREHFIAVLLLPFVLCENSLALGLKPGVRRQVLAAALAAIAVMIKPYFVILPALFLLMRTSLQGIGNVMRSPAAVVLALAGSAYVGITVTLFSEWIEIACSAALLYGAYSADIVYVLRLYYEPSGAQPLQLLLAAIAMIAIAGLLARRERWQGRVLFGMSAAVVAYLLVYLLQMKGFNYHLLPATGTAACTAVLAVSMLVPERFATSREGLANGLIALIVVAAILKETLAQSFEGPGENRSLLQALQARASAGPVFAFTSGMRPMFPIVTEAHLNWASRFPCMWTLVGLHELRARNGSAVSEETMHLLEQQQIDQIVQDLRKAPPATIVVDVGEPKQWLTTPLDFIAYYSRDPRFVEIWAGYRQFARVGRYALYSQRQSEREVVGEKNNH